MRKRTKLFQLRLLEEEAEILEQKAQELKISKSKYLRDLLILGSQYDASISKKDNDIRKQWIYELNRIGNNINQIAYNANSKKSTNSKECLMLTEEVQSLLSLFSTISDFREE